MKSLLIAAMVLTVAGIGGVLLFSGGQEPAQSFPTDPPTDEVVGEATIGQILREPAAFEDQAVVVRGATVTPLEAEGGFVLENEGKRILVYAPGGVPRLEPGDPVGVRGEVVRFTEPAAELLGGSSGRAPRIAGVPTEVGDPYLLFRAVTRPQADADVPDLEESRGRLAAVASDPEEYYGDAVTVGGEVVRAGRRVFVLAAGGEELLVVPQGRDHPELREGVPVRVTGIVVPVESDQEDRLLDERELIEQYEGRASVAATTVAVFGR